MGVSKPQIIGKNGRKEFAVLPYSEFLKIQEALEDYRDLCDLREAKSAERHASTIGLSEVKRRFHDRSARHRKRGA